MFCVNCHPLVAEFIFDSCDECGDLTGSMFKLCQCCSKYLAECLQCRSACDSDIDPLLLAAFASPAAVAARKARRNAVFLKQVYTKALKEASRKAQASAGAIYEAASVAAEKAYDDAIAEDLQRVQLVNQRYWALQAERTLTDEEKATWWAERSAHFAFIAPHRRAYNVTMAPFIEQLKLDTAPAVQLHDVLLQAMNEKCDQLIEVADAALMEIMTTAKTNSKD